MFHHTQGVRVFIFQDDKLLLLRKIEGSQKGTWNAPGGKVEENESVECAAVRETQEEVNLNVSHLLFLGKNIRTNPYYETSLFLARKVSGDLNNNEPDAHCDLTYFSLDDLPRPLGKSTEQGIILLRETQEAQKRCTEECAQETILQECSTCSYLKIDKE